MPDVSFYGSNILFSYARPKPSKGTVGNPERLKPTHRLLHSLVAASFLTMKGSGACDELIGNVGDMYTENQGNHNGYWVAWILVLPGVNVETASCVPLDPFFCIYIHCA